MEMSGSHQVMLVSLDPADLRHVGSHLSLPASISVVSIPDPSDPFHTSHIIIINHHSETTMCYAFKYNQVYKVLVQSSSIQKSSLVLQRVYLKNRADVQVGFK